MTSFLKNNMVIEDYLVNPSAFVKRISFSDRGKVRDIVTYDIKQDDNGGYLLKKEHSKILHELESLPTSKYSYAYKKGVRVLDAVKTHLGNTTFIKLDIKGFFEHVDCEILTKRIKEAGLNIDLRYCLYEHKVPIGFVTSPKLSDFYLYDLDKAVETYIEKHPGLQYSRYADDFLLSSPSGSFNDVISLAEFIKNELNKYHLTLNEEKTIRAKLGKQTSVRFLGLNIGKDKITLSKWYILKTINAFSRYYIARYNKQDNTELLKSIAYGLYNFIEQNSESAKERFIKKYKNTFNRVFPGVLKPTIKDGFITYTLDDLGESYNATIDREKISPKPEEINFVDEIESVPVRGVSICSYDHSLSEVKSIKLPRKLRSYSSTYYSLPSLEKNPINDIVDLKSLKATGNIEDYADVKEVGVVESHDDKWDQDDDFYAIKKVDGGYSAEKIHNGYWYVKGLPQYIKNTSYFVPASKQADQLFYYLIEQVKNNKYRTGYGREMYIIEGKMIKSSPLITIKQIAAMQYFFGEIIRVNTKLLHGSAKLSDNNNARELKNYAHSEDCFDANLPFDDTNKTRMSISLDFAPKEGIYTCSHTFLDRANDNSVFFEKSTQELLGDERIKELLLSSLKDFEETGDDSLFVFTYQNKKYYAKQIKTSLYHLLQFTSPIEFKIADKYLIDDGIGEYLFAACGEKEIPPHAYEGVSSLRVVRISDHLSDRDGVRGKVIGIGDCAFKDCKNLEKVYISTRFYAYRNEDNLIFGKRVFEGCDKFNGSIILYPSDDKDYVCIDENGRLEAVKPIKIEITTLDEISKLDNLPARSIIEVQCPVAIREGVVEAIENNKNIVSWTVRHDGILRKASAPTISKSSSEEPTIKTSVQNKNNESNPIFIDDDLPF